MLENQNFLQFRLQILLLRKWWDVVLYLSVLILLLWFRRKENMGVVLMLISIIRYAGNIMIVSPFFTHFRFLLTGNDTGWSVNFWGWTRIWLVPSFRIGQNILIAVFVVWLILELLISFILMIFYSDKRWLIRLFRYRLNLRVVKISTELLLCFIGMDGICLWCFLNF